VREKGDDDFLVDLLRKRSMKTNRKLKQKKRVKKKEAYLMSFNLLINNQGQFITELSKYPMDKITIFISKKKMLV